MNIYICVYGGIVSGVYAENAPESMELNAVVLDVDTEPGGAGLIQARWDGIAGDAAHFREVGTVSYEPPDGCPD